MTRHGFHLPPRVGWRELTVIGAISAIGFTVALFFSTATMAAGQMLRETTMGVLVGLASIGVAFAAARYALDGIHIERRLPAGNRTSSRTPIAWKSCWTRPPC